MEISKILTGLKLKTREQKSTLTNSTFICKDYLLLTKNTTCEVILEVIENQMDIICDLKDRNGKIGLKVISLENNFESPTSELILEDGVKHNLHERFLYNIKYNSRRKNFILEEHDEYFEKITHSNED